MRNTLRRALAEFIQETEFSSLPPGAVNQAKRCLLDLVGVAIAGSRQPTSDLAKAVIGEHAPPGEATLWTTNRKLSASAAAFLNAVQSHAIDMDDGHRFANGHPGVTTIPAAMALAEARGLGGKDLIAAVVIGYEIFIRLGVANNPDLLQRGFHTTATIGVFAAAAVASRLFKLTQPQTANALSLAGLQSAGLLEALSSGEMGKSFQVGKAVQSGVLAAMLARNGADGPENIFEGEKGFFKSFSGKACNVDDICKNLGEEYQIEGVYFKRHAACRHIHSALDALDIMLKENQLDPADIRSIDVETYTIAVNLTGHLSTQGGELAAKFSLPVAIGLYLVFGRADAAAFSTEKISDPRVQAMAEKVSIRINPAWDAVYPGERRAKVTIRTQDSSYDREVPYPKGEPEFPLSSAELFEKYENNAGMIYSTARAMSLRERIMNLEQDGIGHIATLLEAPD